MSALAVEVLPDAAAVAARAAERIAVEARSAVSQRGRFVLAVSGGHTPWMMLRALAGLELPWEQVHIVQVDERVAPLGDKDRNLTHLHESLLNRAPIPPGNIHAMPVDLPDLDAAAAEYAGTLRAVAGAFSTIDLVHLGLGPDGHTASLVPGDPVLRVTDRLVAATGVYQGHRRMTLTCPAINRARAILWVVTGPEKVDAMARLRRGDHSIPAGRIARTNAVVVADRDSQGPAGSN